MRLLLILAVAVALSAIAIAQQPVVTTAQDRPVDVLDLTSAPASTRGVQLPATGSPVRNQRPPIYLTLLSVDKKQVRIGEDVTYEVVLENTAGVPVILPWSTSPPAGGAAVAEAHLALVVQGDIARDQYIAGRILYGSSTRTLAPGEKVRIRASGPWVVPDPEQQKRMRKRLPRNVRVWAQLNTYDPAAAMPYGKTVSASSFSMEVHKEKKS